MEAEQIEQRCWSCGDAPSAGGDLEGYCSVACLRRAIQLGTDPYQGNYRLALEAVRVIVEEFRQHEEPIFDGRVRALLDVLETQLEVLK